MESVQSNNFNQSLWSIIMSNKFKENWRDERKLDITTQGDKINETNQIQIEIIRKAKDDE
jgi:hypothetical protein